MIFFLSSFFIWKSVYFLLIGYESNIINFQYLNAEEILMLFEVIYRGINFIHA